jgi:hypothetical protein
MEKEICINEFMLLPNDEDSPFLLDGFETFFIFENIKCFKNHFYRDGEFYCVLL